MVDVSKTNRKTKRVNAEKSLVVESRAEIPDEVTDLKEITKVAIGNLIWYYLDMGYLHMHGLFLLQEELLSVGC